MTGDQDRRLIQIVGVLVTSGRDRRSCSRAARTASVRRGQRFAPPGPSSLGEHRGIRSCQRLATTSTRRHQLFKRVARAANQSDTSLLVVQFGEMDQPARFPRDGGRQCCLLPPRAGVPRHRCQPGSPPCRPARYCCATQRGRPSPVPPKVNAAPPRFATESTSFSPSGQKEQGVRRERIVPDEVRDRTEILRLAILPAGLPVAIHNAEHVEGAPSCRDDLDANGNAALTVDMPTLLPITYARPFVTRRDEPGLPSLSGGVRTGNACGAVAASRAWRRSTPTSSASSPERCQSGWLIQPPA